MIKLSICIATYNRSNYLYQTLTCLHNQLCSGVEIIIVDGASTDDTNDVAQIFSSRSDSIHYYREEKNSGVDADYDKAVKYAHGEYCWLFSDDDLLINGAINYILSFINENYNLFIVNSSIYNKNMDVKLLTSIIKNKVNQEYITETDLVFKKYVRYLSFIGAIIIKRVFWLSREREIYHGSEFAHIAILFQYPPISNIKIIAKPLIMIRYGNSQWASRGFEVWMNQWPSIINDLNSISIETRNIVLNNNFKGLLKFCCLYRAMGIYNIEKYNLHFNYISDFKIKVILWAIAHIPSKLFNATLALLLIGGSKLNIYRLTNSSSSTQISQWVAKFRRIK
jgi:abequosyltransferase